MLSGYLCISIKETPLQKIAKQIKIWLEIKKRGPFSIAWETALIICLFILTLIS